MGSEKVTSNHLLLPSSEIVFPLLCAYIALGLALGKTADHPYVMDKFFCKVERQPSGQILLKKRLIRSLAFLLFVVLVSNQVSSVGAEAFADPSGDLFDRQERPVTAESYLDIIEGQVVQFGAEYRACMRMNGPLPSSLSDPSIFIEWDLLVDIDQDPRTYPWGAWLLVDNGIGVDVLVRLMLGPRGQGFQAEVRDSGKKTSQRIEFKTDGAILELIFTSSSIGNPKAFDYVFAVRKFGDYGRAGAEIVLDKTPNQGYFTFSDSWSTLVATRPRVQGLPDLAVTRIWLTRSGKQLWWVPIAPSSGDTFFIVQGVANFGEGSAVAYHIDYYYDKSHERGGPSRLDGGRVTYWYLGPIEGVRGEHTVRVVVNENRSVAESDFGNNGLTITFQIEDTPFSQAHEITTGLSCKFVYPSATFHDSRTYQNRVRVTASANLSIIAALSESGDANLFRDGNLMRSLSKWNARSIALSPDGRYFALGGLTGTTVYDTRTSKFYDFEPATEVALSNTGLLALATSTERPGGRRDWNRLLVIDLSTGKRIWSRDFAEYQTSTYYVRQWAGHVDISSLKFAEDGNRILVCLGSALIEIAPKRQSYIYLLDAYGNPVWSQELDISCRESSMSSDGMSVVAAGHDGYLYFFDRATNKTWRKLVGTQQEMNTYGAYLPVAISSDGQYLATATRGFVCIFDKLGNPLVRFRMENTSSLLVDLGLVLAGGVGEARLYSMWNLVDEAISQAEISISNATETGADTAKSKELLGRATAARNSLLWFDAYTLATQARISATQALESYSNAQFLRAATQLGKAEAEIVATKLLMENQEVNLLQLQKQLWGVNLFLREAMTLTDEARAVLNDAIKSLEESRMFLDRAGSHRYAKEIIRDSGLAVEAADRALAKLRQVNSLMDQARLAREAAVRIIFGAYVAASLAIALVAFASVKILRRRQRYTKSKAG
jgi:hypothetical protein